MRNTILMHYSMFSPKNTSFIHVLDQRFAQDTACMLLIVLFSSMANPKNFHTWLLAPDWGFSQTSAVSDSAMAHRSMYDPLHTDEQKSAIFLQRYRN